MGAQIQSISCLIKILGVAEIAPLKKNRGQKSKY